MLAHLLMNSLKEVEEEGDAVVVVVVVVASVVGSFVSGNRAPRHTRSAP